VNLRAVPGRATLFALANMLLWPGLATLLGYALSLENKPGASVVYVLAVALSTYFGGVIFGILSAILSFFGLSYFFVSPVHSLELHAQNVTGLVLFMFAALGVGYLLVRERRAKHRSDSLLLESARLLSDRVRYDLERERRLERERFLARAGVTLASSLDYEQTLAEVARLATPEIADRCSVELFEAGERVPEDAPQAPDLSPGTIRVPLSARGHVVGAITFQLAGSGRRFDEDDLNFARELALHASLAIENGRLHRAEQEAHSALQVVAARLDRLHRVAAALSRAVTIADALNAILGEGIAASGASAGMVGLLTEDGETVEIAASRGYGEGTFELWRTFPVSRRLPLSEVVRTGQAFFCETAAEREARWPSFATGSGDAFVALPLAARGAVLGALGLSFEGDRAFSPEERELLLTVARQCGQALERARLFEREHEIAVAVQRSLLPKDLAVSEEVAVAARYLPGSPGLEIGGDWYDVVRLGPRELVISIGDVVGHGLKAAATMGQLRNAVRAYALERSSPAEIVSHLNTFVSRFPDGEFSTLFVGRLDLDRHVLEYTNAGHPPPLLRRPDGETVWLDDARAFPIGVEVGAPCPTGTVDLEPDTILLLYTDGLVERRTRSLEEGLAVLERVIEEGSDDPEELLEEVIAKVVEDGVEHSDDIAMVTFRFLPKPGFQASLDRRPESAGELRNRLQAWLVDVGATPDEIFDVSLACSEAFANAIEHPMNAADRSIDVEAFVSNGELTLVVRDYGGWREHRSREEGGLGLPLMRSLMTSVEVRRRPEGTTVVLRRRLQAAIAA
jgi:GAF domain-containing protein/anti-sigma regulatory factor (Ser/Thr protein kinase)